MISAINILRAVEERIMNMEERETYLKYLLEEKF